MTDRPWRDSFRSWSNPEAYAHPDSPAGGTGTGFSRRPGGGYGWAYWPSQVPYQDSPAGKQFDWRGRLRESGLGLSSYSITQELLRLAPHVVLQFSIKFAADAKKGNLEKWADQLGTVSLGLNLTGAGLVLAGPLTGFSTAVVGEGVGMAAGFVDLGAGTLYFIDSAVRGDRRSLKKGAFSFGSVLLDAGTANIGAVGVKNAARGSKQFVFKSTSKYITYKIGAEHVVWRFLQGELYKRVTDLMVDHVKS